MLMQISCSYSLQSGESAAHGALIEFHRQKMAFSVRQAKEEMVGDAGAGREAWDLLQAKHPDLLQDILERRSISWGEIDGAEMPLFGKKKDDKAAAERAARLAEQVTYKNLNKDLMRIPPAAAVC